MEPEAKRPKVANGDAREAAKPLDFPNLGCFEMKRILSDNVERKTVCMEGRIRGQGNEPAILILDKMPFSLDNLDQVLSGGASSSEVFRNDIYGKYQCRLPAEANLVKANLIYPATEKHLKKYEVCPTHIIYETPAMFRALTLKFLATETFHIDWVHNILDHKKEAETIVYEDPDKENGFILLPDFKWNGKHMEDLYLLGIAHNPKVKSLRTLNQTHLPLLKKIWFDGTKAIQDKYNVPASQIRAYLHYQPSYYHLHVHFSHVQYNAPGINTERGHLLPFVIHNIETRCDFYQRAILPFPVKESENLYKFYKNAGYDFQSPKMNPTIDDDLSEVETSSNGLAGLIQLFKAFGKAKHEPCSEHSSVTFGESAWRLAIMAMCVSPRLDRKRLIQVALTSAFTSLGTGTDHNSEWRQKLVEVREILFKFLPMGKAAQLYNYYEMHVNARRGLDLYSEDDRIYRNLLEFEEQLLLWEEHKNEEKNPSIEILLKKMCAVKFPGYEKYLLFGDASELQHLLTFLLKISELCSLKRTGWVHHDVPDPERVAGHMFRMGLMGMILDQDQSHEILDGSAVIISVVHDMAECVVGDITPKCNVSVEEKHKLEMKAMRTLVEKLPGPLAKDFFDTFKRYESQPTGDNSAVLTKDLDKFDMILQAMEYEEKQPLRRDFLEEFFEKREFKTKKVQKLDTFLRDSRKRFHKK